MIAEETLEFFDPVLAYLPRLVPAAAIAESDAPLAEDTRFLHPLAHPPDPDHAAIVAIIDYAIPFAHPLFTVAGGQSRFAAIWLMEGSATERRPDIAFGRELRGPRIDAMRLPDDPEAAYRSCGLMQPGRCMKMARATSHGAAVAALAGGHLPSDENGRRFPLVGVSLPQSVIAETSGSLAALFIQAAVIFVIARARALAREMTERAGRTIRPPLVVNLSLGVTAGADDGSGPLTRLLDAIGKHGIDDLGRIHVVVPTGNHRQDRLRAKLFAGQAVGWNIPPADPTPNALEIWAAPTEPAPQLAIETPDGARLDIPLSSSGAGSLRDAKNNPIGRVVLQQRGAPFGRACHTVILPPTLPKSPSAPHAPPGLWHLHILKAGESGCDLVIHRDDRLPGIRAHGLQSRLVEKGYSLRTEDGRWPGQDPDQAGAIRRNGTLNAYARGKCQIRVGASLARPPGHVSPYSGLLVDGTAGDVTAPADASPSRTGMNLPTITPAGRQSLSGTSLSAPQVTRWLAARLAERRDIPDRAALRAALEGTDPPDLGMPVLPWRHGLRD